MYQSNESIDLLYTSTTLKVLALHSNLIIKDIRTLPTYVRTSQNELKMLIFNRFEVIYLEVLELDFKFVSTRFLVTIF